jgi:catechol 2,3-dioxygenase-like lactoylglutathione lyase family enzyme
MIDGLSHVNVVVPMGSSEEAKDFYGKTLGLEFVLAPEAIRTDTMWFNIGKSGQQVHVAPGVPSDFEDAAVKSSRHACFHITGGAESLMALQNKVYKHFQDGGASAPKACDVPGGPDSGTLRRSPSPYYYLPHGRS